MRRREYFRYIDNLRKAHLICTVLMRWLYDSVGSLPVPTPSPSPLLQEYTVEFTVQTTTLHEVVRNITKNLRMNVNLQ